MVQNEVWEWKETVAAAGHPPKKMDCHPSNYAVKEPIGKPICIPYGEDKVLICTSYKIYRRVA